MDHLAASRLRSMGILDPRVVEEVLEQHFAGRADWSHQIWCLLTPALWWHQFIEQWSLTSQRLDAAVQARR